MLTRILGLLASFAIAMVGIISEDYGTAHIIWSAILFFILFLINVSGGLFFLEHPYAIKKIGYFNIAVGTLHMIYIFILNPDLIVLEWIIHS